MRKILSVVLTVVMCLSIVASLSIMAIAENYPSISSSKYIEFTAATKMTVYVDSSFSAQGTSSPYKKYGAYISKNDVCYIYKITSSYAQISYPTSSGRKTGYIMTSALLGGNMSPSNVFTATSKQTTYKYKNGASTGYYTTGDNVYVLNGTNYNIIYSANSGKRAYKLAWGNVSTSTPATEKTATIKEGIYTIYSAVGKNMVLDVSGGSTANGANVWIWSDCNVDNQRFKIEKSGSYYTITAIHSGKVVDVSNAGTANGTNVQQYEKNGTNAQKWQFLDAGNGYYYIKSALGKYLDVEGGNSWDGVNVQIYEGNKTNAQKWKLVGVSTNTAQTSNELLFPLKGSITRSSNAKTNGIYCDYKASSGTPVYAPADGTVVYKQAYKNTSDGEKLSSYGNYIEFTSSDKVYKVKCCHLSSFSGVKAKIEDSLKYPCSGSHATSIIATRTVKQGEVLGYIGMTGNASGPHLHLEVYKNGEAVNPTNVFTTW